MSRKHPSFVLNLLISVFAFAISAGTPVISVAGAETERTELVHLIHELEHLEARIERAGTAASSTQRVHFQYSWLRADLARVKAGIREYLESVPVTPRDVPPLAGDYIR